MLPLDNYSIIAVKSPLPNKEQDLSRVITTFSPLGFTLILKGTGKPMPFRLKVFYPLR